MQTIIHRSLIFLLIGLLWNSFYVLNAQELHRFKAHKRSYGLNQALISPQGDFVFTAGQDSSAKLWTIKGDLVHTFKHEDKNVKAIAYSPNGKLLASGGGDEQVKVWNASNGKLLYTLSFENSITSLAFSPDNAHLIVGERRNHLLIYEAKKGKLFKEIPFRANWASQISFTPDGKRIAMGISHKVEYLSYPEGKSIPAYDDLKYETGTKPYGNEARFSPDGKQLLLWYSGDFNATYHDRMQLWNAESAELVKAYAGLRGDFDAVFSPDAKYLLIGGYHWEDKDFSENTGTIQLVEVSSAKVVARIQAHKAGIESLAFSKDGKYLMSSSKKDREVIIWDAAQVLATRNVSDSKSIKNSDAKTKENKEVSMESLDLDQLDLSQSNGKYYALIISVNQYQDEGIKDLNEPQKDAKSLKSTLEKYYKFEAENTIHLTDPTRSAIITELDKLSRKVGEEDNLLVFYAGHGYWDEDLQQGYWLPSDAQANFRANWLANSELGNYIRGIKSKHTLLVTDACFSGSIFENTRNAFENAPQHIQNLYERASRKAMTSGMKEEVPDKSVFLEYLIKGLQENKEPYLTAGELYQFILEPVLSNTKNAPQFGVIRNTNHEGGDFIFMKK